MKKFDAARLVAAAILTAVIAAIVFALGAFVTQFGAPAFGACALFCLVCSFIYKSLE